MKKIIKNIIGRGGLDFYHHLEGHMAAALHGYPSNDMRVIGITGTNGKTTTANLIASIFETAGYKVALATTIQFRVNGKERINKLKMTMPNAFQLNKFILEASQEKCQILVLEVTSIALSQMRAAGVLFDTVVLTNITHDHLDYHGTIEKYAQAKRKLFENNPRISVLNIDDKNGLAFSNLEARRHINYSLKSKDDNVIHPIVVKYEDGVGHYKIYVPTVGELNIKTTLPGDFNIENIMATIGVGVGFNLDVKKIEEGIASVKSVAGRMEVISAGQPFDVIVDYAHTPDALEKMYAAIKAQISDSGSIISVLGSCGDRDKTKRPVLGEIAGRNAKYIIVTNEDPYTEDPEQIINAVASGITQGNEKHKEESTYWRIFDRRDAIAKALGLAKPGDIVTITGKGAETAMVWGNEHRPWSDVEVTNEELRKLLGK